MFIRAPKVERVGEGVEVLAEHQGVPVLLRRGRVSVASFHPELSGDARLHRSFIDTLTETTECPAIRNGQPSSTRRAPPTRRGKLFAKIARQIEVSAKAGGGDIDSNPTLRTAVAKARAARMTNDAIDRAIKRGTGEGGGDTYESITYEGAPPAASRC